MHINSFTYLTTLVCILTERYVSSPIEKVVIIIHWYILGCVICDDLTTETEMDVHTVMVGGDERMGLLTHTGSSHCCS